MNASNYGVPQNRKRLIFIGIRKDIRRDPSFPEPSGKVVTVGEALVGTPIDEEELKKLEIRPTNLARKIQLTVRMGDSAAKYNEKGSYFNHFRLHINKLSPVIPSQNACHIIHYMGKRYISVSEMKRLCGFPDDYMLMGARTKQMHILGNAVMPPMMEAIARNLIENVLKKRGK
jgi:DNA (cytosine-5)-methyltransferase 1